VSNEGRNKLNKNESGGGKNPLEAMKTTLSSMSCPNVYSVKDRLYSAIEQLIIEISDQEDEEIHANIMFFVLSKRNDEQGYEFYDENDEVPSPKLDLQAVLYKTMRNIRTSNIAYVYRQLSKLSPSLRCTPNSFSSIRNINFELVRLFPGAVPNDVSDRPQEQVSMSLGVLFHTQND
jgi:hypothetical protein